MDANNLTGKTEFKIKVIYFDTSLASQEECFILCTPFINTTQVS